MPLTYEERARRYLGNEHALAHQRQRFAKFLSEKVFELAPAAYEGTVHTNGYGGRGRYSISILPNLPDDEREQTTSTGLYLRRKHLTHRASGTFDQDVMLVEGSFPDVADCTDLAVELGGLTQVSSTRTLRLETDLGEVRDKRTLGYLIGLTNLVMGASGLKQFS